MKVTRISAFLCISAHFSAFLCISLHFSAFLFIYLHFPTVLWISRKFSGFLLISLHFFSFLSISLDFSAFLYISLPFTASLYILYSRTIVRSAPLSYGRNFYKWALCWGEGSGSLLKIDKIPLFRITQCNTHHAAVNWSHFSVAWVFSSFALKNIFFHFLSFGHFQSKGIKVWFRVCIYFKEAQVPQILSWSYPPVSIRLSASHIWTWNPQAFIK